MYIEKVKSKIPAVRKRLHINTDRERNFWCVIDDYHDRVKLYSVLYLKINLFSIEDHF